MYGSEQSNQLVSENLADFLSAYFLIVFQLL